MCADLVRIAISAHTAVLVTQWRPASRGFRQAKTRTWKIRGSSLSLCWVFRMRRIDNIARVGADLAKSVVQVHAVDASGEVVVARKYGRAEFIEWCERLPSGCTVAFEACCGAHHLARELVDRDLSVRLIAPSFVAPYRMVGPTGKNDANDAAAICEAASRPQMRFVEPKSQDQLAWLAVHRLRDGYIKERTACMNRTRGLLYEFGLQFPLSVSKFEASMLDVLGSVAAKRLPPLARTALRRSRAHFRELARQIRWCDEQIAEHIRTDTNAMRALSVRGIGPIGASALAAALGDLSQFANGRQFSSFLGLVPSQRSSGGRQRLGSITKRGDPYLRKLLIMGARSALFSAPGQDTALAQWATNLRSRIGWQKATVALANRNARLLWRTLACRTSTNSHRIVARAGGDPDRTAGPNQLVPPFVANDRDGISPELGRLLAKGADKKAASLSLDDGSSKSSGDCHARR